MPAVPSQNCTFPAFQHAGLGPRALYLSAPASHALTLLPEAGASMAVTSPPYWARRRYTEAGEEIGVGDFDRYLEDLLETFRQVRRVLHPEGLLWVNIGDTAAGSGGSGGDYRPGGRYEDRPRYRQGRAPVRAGQWSSVPHRLAHALQDDGWLLRSEIIWDKGIRRPESLQHARRPGESHEYVFMFSRSRSYRFDAAALAEQGSVWHVPAERTRTGHQAAMPVELARRCVRPGTAPGFVLDPFAGSGTTLLAALQLGRPAVGIDLDPSAAGLVAARLGPGMLALTPPRPLPAAKRAVWTGSQLEFPGLRTLSDAS